MFKDSLSDHQNMTQYYPYQFDKLIQHNLSMLNCHITFIIILKSNIFIVCSSEHEANLLFIVYITHNNINNYLI